MISWWMAVLLFMGGVGGYAIADEAWPHVRHAGVSVGYWVRPYDDVLDARRWRWQPAGKCDLEGFVGLPDSVRAELSEAVRQAMLDRLPTAPCVDVREHVPHGEHVHIITGISTGDMIVRRRQARCPGWRLP